MPLLAVVYQLGLFLVGIFLAASCLVVLVNVALWLLEVRFLKKTLLGLVPRGRFETRDDLVRFKNHLSRRIGFDMKRIRERRPILRQSASDTLKKGYGYCGENARVVILLFWLSGIRANRVYVDGPRWGHVLVEHEWHGEWKFFDAHGDPAVSFSDDLVGNVDSPEIEKLPNRHRAVNPWQSFYRMRLFHLMPYFRELERARPPHLFVVFAESPSLVRALAASLVGLVAGFFLLA